MKTFLIRELKKIIRWILGVPSQVDVWEKQTADPSVFRLINRIRKDIPKDFKYFFQGDLITKTNSIEEICDWLRKCAYVKDQDQFNCRDFWQHPKDFEITKKGDCEDHALWAWRKIVELGYQAEFVVGRAHAWVHFIKDDKLFLLEATSKDQIMWHSMEEIKDKYIPILSVDGNNDVYIYGGAYKILNE